MEGSDFDTFVEICRFWKVGAEQILETPACKKGARLF